MDNHPVKLNTHPSLTRGDNHQPYARCGNYLLLDVLGKGGFATTYLGQHIYLGTTAAVKVLHTQLTDEEKHSFLREARIVAHSKHKHIVSVLDFGIDRSVPFLVMEYAPFGTLRQRHPNGSQLSLETVLLYVKQIAKALQHLHDARLIHCDLKPENLLIAQDKRILLSDFGVAAIVHHGDILSTISGGTIAYMAPECFSSQTYYASDQYALGIMVYEWLCGGRPFLGSKPAMMRQHIQESPMPLHLLAPTVPPAVEAVVLRALEKQPAQRFPSVQAFAQALEDAIASTALYATQPTIIPRRSSRTQPSAPIAKQRCTTHQSNERNTSIAPAHRERSTAMAPYQKIARLFGIDILIGSAVFVVLALLGVPTNTLWFYAFLCMGAFPLIGALMMKSAAAFFCAGSIFIIASMIGVQFHSPILFGSVYAILLLLCWLVSLAVINRHP